MQGEVIGFLCGIKHGVCRDAELGLVRVVAYRRIQCASECRPMHVMLHGRRQLVSGYGR